MAAFAAGGYGPGAHFVAKFDGGNEAVAARTVPFLCGGIRTRAERCQGTPNRRRKAHWDARPRVVEWLGDIAGQALEAIDVSPGRFPSPEIRRELVRRVRERLQKHFSRRDR